MKGEGSYSAIHKKIYTTQELNLDLSLYKNDTLPIELVVWVYTYIYLIPLYLQNYIYYNSLYYVYIGVYMFRHGRDSNSQTVTSILMDVLPIRPPCLLIRECRGIKPLSSQIAPGKFYHLTNTPVKCTTDRIWTYAYSRISEPKSDALNLTLPLLCMCCSI